MSELFVSSQDSEKADGKNNNLTDTDSVFAVDEGETQSVIGCSDARDRGLSDEDILELKRAQKRNFIVFALLGVFLAVLGFFAGQNFRAQKSEDQSMVSYSFVQEADGESVADFSFAD